MLSRTPGQAQVLNRVLNPVSNVHPAGSFSAASTFDTLDDALDLMGAVMPFSRDMEIYGEGEPADSLYRVVSGAVRTHKLLNDGRRQIGGFYLPGDILGMEAGDVNRLSAEAICDSKILVVARSAVIELASRQCEVARQLWAATTRELEHLQNLMLTLGRKTAQERIATFLLEMVSRSCEADAVDLPMSRQDIADYLGMTIETVSRTLTQLENASAIALPSSRRVVLRNRAALNRLNS